MYITRKPSPYRAVNTPVSVIKTSQLMLYREIIAVCSQIHTKNTNSLCGQNIELLNVRLGVRNYQWALKRKDICRKHQKPKDPAVRV